MKTSPSRIQRFLFCLLFCFIYINQIHAQKFEFEGKRKKYTLDFKMVQNLIVIPIYINQKGPYNFLLDTGVAQMIITDTTFLKNYQLEKYQTIKVQGYGFGESIDAILTRDLNVRIGKAKISRIPTAIFTEDIFNLSNYLGVHISGILGYYFFNSFQVKINYNHGTLTFYKPGTLKKIKGTKIPIVLKNAKPYINMSIETPQLGKTDLHMLIDNGSSHAMTLESFKQAPFPLPDSVISANLGVGINGIINGAIGRIDTVHIDGFSFNHVLTGFPTYHKEMSDLEGANRNGSIGADLLKNFTVTFDYGAEVMYLKRAYTHSPKFEHDMAGIEIYTNDKKVKRYFIGRIEQGSPAETAGLQPEDEIIAVDFRDVIAYTLNDLIELFKSRDGRNILLEIRRKSDFHVIVLTLKKRI